MSSDKHLSRMSTCWSLVSKAHSRGPGASDAQLELLKRYGDVIQRYLHGALRDADAAAELSQEFALRFIRGDFSGLNPGKGRFRDYVKTVLFRMVADYHKERRKRPQSLPAQVAEPAECDADFVATWRSELLDRAWRGLLAMQQETGRPYHQVLQLRLEQPDQNSAALADSLGRQLGKRMTAETFRKTLQRAREKFAELLLDDVFHSLDSPSRQELEQELRELGFLAWCQPMIDRWPVH